MNEQINDNIEKISNQKKILNVVKKNISDFISQLLIYDCFEELLEKEEFIDSSIDALDDVLEMEVETIQDLKKFCTHVDLLFEAHNYPMTEGELKEEIIIHYYRYYY